MLLSLFSRVVRTVDSRCLWKFGWNFGVKGGRSVRSFRRRLDRGEYFPAFLHLSITSRCNLRCSGCWVDVGGAERRMDAEDINRLIREAKGMGNSFFGLLGGEPFMHPGLFDVLEAHPDCYFQVFTNGQFITESVAARLRQSANATPIVSIEGRELVSDQRRGGRDVFQRSMRGLENCVRARLLTGVATSICQSNLYDLLSEHWLEELIKRGVHYVWYYVYRPAGPNPSHDLALRPDQQLRVRRFVVEMRRKMPIAIVDSYFDHNGMALCPMTTGISHHVGPGGDIEPCPVIQFAVENVRDSRGVREAIRGSTFLRDFRETAARHTRGCILLERPDLVKELVLRHRARDTTSRGTAMTELEAMRQRPSQWLAGQEIPEQHWLYYMVKKRWFHDFDVYGNLGSATAGSGTAPTGSAVTTGSPSSNTELRGK